MPLERRQDIIDECTELVMSLNHCSDLHEYDRSVEHFTTDGSFIANGKIFAGHEELRAMYASRSPTVVSRHLVTNVRIFVHDNTHASGISYNLAIIVDPKTPEPALPVALEPFSMGEWHDEFRRTPDGWRFSRHEVRRIFMRQTQG